MAAFRRKKAEPLAVYDDVSNGLKEIYKKKLLPLEKETDSTLQLISCILLNSAKIPYFIERC